MTPGAAGPGRRPVPAGVIGMVHLPPLPGSPRWNHRWDDLLDRTRADARALAHAPVDAILVENYGDAPFLRDRVPAVTIAAMTAAVLAVREVADLPVGVNVLRNDARAALAVATATGASFIRVNVHTGAMLTDQGWIEGRAAHTLRDRARFGGDVAILADVLVKHATAPPGLTLADAARDAWERGLADALIVSGSATGAPASLDDARALAAAVPEAPIVVGSGVTAASVRETLAVARAVIAGSALERDGRAGAPVDPDRVQAFMTAARGDF